MVPHPLIVLISSVIAGVAVYRALRKAIREEVAYLRLRRGGTRLRGEVVGHDPRPVGRNSREYTVVPKVRYFVCGETFEATVENYGGDLIPVGSGMDLVVDEGFPGRPYAFYMGTAGPTAALVFGVLIVLALLALGAAASLR